ncbi:MAG: GAF domain-containing protein [Betaproteobacteria bacterium]|nr:GAF domain-containing protein [Betaproteobacteria bacterium]
MFTAHTSHAQTKADLYRDLHAQLRGLLEGERDLMANTANVAALIYFILPDLNWAGFYFLRGNDLVLGPFQGKPACVRIPVYPTPRGVCGNTAFQRKTHVVTNVHDFPGHIACDSASNAEIVIPLIQDGRLLGVLDLDSPTLARFDDEDRQGLETLVAIFLGTTDFAPLLLS